MNLTPLTLYDAKTLPIKGLFSKSNATTIPAGAMSVLKNWRFDENLPRGRWGMARPGTSPTAFAGDSRVGGWIGTLNGTPYSIWADYNSSGGAVLLYSYNFSTGAVTELTATSGKYGSTRMSFISPGLGGSYVCMASTKDFSNGKEYLIVSDGVGYPRVFDAENSIVAINQPMSTTPEKTPIRSAVVTFPVYITLSDPANTDAATNTGSGVTSADSGSSPNAFYVLTIASTATDNSTTQLNMTSTVDYSSSRQIVVYYETEYTTFWEKFKFEIGENGSYSTVWDPEASPRTNNPIIIPADTSGKKWYAVFSLDHIAASSRNAVDEYRWTLVRQAPSSSQTVNVYGIMGSGKILGQAYHALSYFNEGSRAESAGIWYGPEHYAGEGLRNLGVRSTDDGTLPNDPRVYYDYKLFIPNPVTADLQAGWDRIRIYRSDVGEDPLNRTLVTSYTVGSYAAGWTFASGSSGSLLTLTDNTAVGSKNTAVPAPDYNTLTIPKSSALMYEGKRLFCVAYDGNSAATPTTTPTTMFVSDLGHFSRFRYFHESEDQGTTVSLSGECGQELKAMPTAMRGVPSCYLWTDRNLYRFTPTTATQINYLERVSPYGTLCRFSVATSPDSIFWLDQTGVVRKLTPRGAEDISSFSIADKIPSGASSPAYVRYEGWMIAFGAYHNQKYYLARDAAGVTNHLTATEEPLVYDDRLGIWVEDDIGGTAESCRLPISWRGKLYCASKSKYVMEYERDTTMVDGYQVQAATGGTAFDLSISTGYLSPPDNGFVTHRVDVMCDDVTGGTASYTMTYLPSGGTATATADIDDTGTIQWCCSGTPASASDGFGLACKFDAVFSASAGTAGMRLYKWRAMIFPQEVEPRNNN